MDLNNPKHLHHINIFGPHAIVHHTNIPQAASPSSQQPLRLCVFNVWCQDHMHCALHRGCWHAKSQVPGPCESKKKVGDPMKSSEDLGDLKKIRKQCQDIYIWLYIYTYIHICICICTCVYIYMYLSTYIQRIHSMYIYIYMYLSTYIQRIHSIYIYIYVCVCVYIYIHVWMYTIYDYLVVSQN